MSHTQVTPEYLAEIVEAFNRHDLEAILSYFADDGVFRTARGQAPAGEEYVGRENIRAFLSARGRAFPDWRWIPLRNWTAGERGVAEWKVVGTDPDGGRFEWLGCDLFEFENGKIKMKDTFWKAP